MSDQNREDGRSCYASGDAECRTWFERQWHIWPERQHPERTTNLSFHHGGVQAFRAAHGHEPAMSEQFASNVAWLDRRLASQDEGVGL